MGIKHKINLQLAGILTNVILTLVLIGTVASYCSHIRNEDDYLMAVRTLSERGQKLPSIEDTRQYLKIIEGITIHQENEIQKIQFPVFCIN